MTFQKIVNENCVRKSEIKVCLFATSSPNGCIYSFKASFSKIVDSIKWMINVCIILHHSALT